MVAFFNFKGMAVKSVQFKGIVRNLSPLNNVDGSCEEVINLRLDSGAWRVVGKKRRILKNVDYDQVYVHKYGAFENYIGVKDGRVTWFGSVVDGVVVSKEQEVCRTSGEVVFSQLNNMLLVKGNNDIYKAVFIDGKYSASLIGLPDISLLDIKHDVKTVSREKFTCTIGNDPTNSIDRDDYLPLIFNKEQIKAVNETIRGEINKLKDDNKEYTEGRVFMCVTYELFDGSVTKPSPPMLINLSAYNKDVYERIIQPLSIVVDVTDPQNKILYSRSSFGTIHLSLEKISVKPTFEFSDDYKDLIRSINIYSTQPMSFYDLDKIQVDCLKGMDGHNFYYIEKDGKIWGTDKENIEGIPKKELKKEEVDKLIFYNVSKFNLPDINDWDYKEVKFNDSLTTNPTMPVDSSGWFNTSGDMFVYNKRLHLFNLKRKMFESKNMGRLWGGFPVADSHRMYTAVTYVKAGQGDLKIKNEFSISAKVVDGVVTNDFVLPEFIAFPDSRAYKMEIYYDNVLHYTLRLSSSSTYNYAFVLLSGVEEKIDTTITLPEAVCCYEDGENIIVSEVANPYFFPPEHSYLAPGEVVAMAVANDQISESQVGQYPLYVFTTEGVYALQVGEGKVLYSNIIPISAEVATGGVLQTKYGVVFVTGSGLKLISGRDVVDVSEPICGMLEGNLRESKDFKGITNHELLYDARLILSAVPFEEYVKGAVMGYDLRKDELIVSNAVYGYSYVFGLKSRVWHKITEVFESFNRYVGLMREGDGCSVCDVREEEDCVQVVHLHTRPMCLDSYGFKKMTHVLFRGEFKPNDKRHGVYVFGSNGLDDWRCVADGQFVVDRCHVPLARIFYSFRYFAIVCGGEVRPGHLVTHVDFDGEVMFDNRMR